MRRQITVVAGLAVVAAFTAVARTGGAPSSPAASAPSTAAGGGSGGGRELSIGAPQSGPPGDGVVTVSGAVRATYHFTQVSCIRSPSTPTGLVAKGVSRPNSPNPITIDVSTDDSTLNLITMRISSTQSWSIGQSDSPQPHIRRSGKTITFSGQLRTQESGAGVAVRGSLTCGPITTLG